MTDYFAANDLAAFVQSAGTPAEGSSAGRYDPLYTTKAIAVGNAGCVITSAKFIDPTTGANVNLTDAWLHYEQYGASINTFRITLYNSVGTAVVRFTMPTAGLARAEYWDGAAWQIAGTTAAWPSNDGVRHIYDWHVVCGAGGSITLYGDNGGPFITSGALNAAVTNLSYFTVECTTANGNLQYSQFLVSDQSTVGAKVASPVFNANGANTTWTNDYLNLVKSGYNDATMISSTTLGDKESYAATDVTLPTAQYYVSSVFYAIRARLNSGAPANIKPLMRIGGVDYAGAYNFPQLNAVGFGPSIAAFVNDPSTGVAFNGVANVNAAELGYQTAA